jgi:hypothetical protein
MGDKQTQRSKMKHKDTIMRTVIPGLVAAAVIGLSFVIPIKVKPDALIGATTVLFLLAIAGLEYGPAIKRAVRSIF